MITLIVARHGNTFNKGETPTRVGAKTDLPLVSSGIDQGRLIGKWLEKEKIIPEITYAAPLKRTMQTAIMALREMKLAEIVKPLDIFTEIDYGPDENKTEDEVIARIGEKAIDEWNKTAKVPDGWKVDPASIIKNWTDFAKGLVKAEVTTAMVVTSNGIARFAPYITEDFDDFATAHDIKIGTGCLAIFKYNGEKWSCDGWNVKPKDFVSL